MPLESRSIGIKMWRIGATEDIRQDGWANTNGKWVAIGDLSKLLGTPFGFQLELQGFLVNRVKRKLKYGAPRTCHLQGEPSSLTKFWCHPYGILLWCGHVRKKFLRRIKTLVHNYLWIGSESTTIARVNWYNCTMPKKVECLSLILPKNAMKGLMSEWVIQTLLPSKSNLRIILRYHITIRNPRFLWCPKKTDVRVRFDMEVLLRDVT